jgi:AbrB family looped-hinge helix DNA binding protein
MGATKAGAGRRQRKSAQPRRTVQDKATPEPGFKLYVKPPKPRPKAKITSKGQITLPQYLRRELGVKVGDEVEFEYVEDFGWRVRRVVDPAKIQRALEKWRGKLHPYFKGMTTDEIMEELRGPVDLD